MTALLVAASALLFALPASAGVATRPLTFLTQDFHARAVGLGGAYSALTQDASAIHYNPAGLAGVRTSEATLMHSSLAEGIAQEHAAYASPSGWALGLTYQGSGRITRTTVSHPEGGVGDTQSADVAFAGGYGASLGRLSAGGAVKLIRGSVDDHAAFGAAFDVGVQYRLALLRGVTLSAAALNLGPDVKFQERSETLPMSLRAGAAWSFLLGRNQGALTAELHQGLDGATLPGGGAELVVAKVMPVRLGVAAAPDDGAQVTAGVGWLLGAASFDYGLTPFSALGVEHRFSVTMRWGDR